MSRMLDVWKARRDFSFWDFLPQNYFPLVILLCLINNRALANHFNEVYITERCVWSAVLRIAKANKISCERGRMSMACIWKVLFGEIFPASQTSPRRTKESTSKIGFALINGRYFATALMQLLLCECVKAVCDFYFFYYASVCMGCVPVNACVTELFRQRISRNLSSAMLMLAGRQTWGLTEEPIIIILEKWSKVSFYSPPDEGEVVYHFGKMFGCLPCMSALGP